MTQRDGTTMRFVHRAALAIVMTGAGALFGPTIPRAVAQGVWQQKADMPTPR